MKKNIILIVMIFSVLFCAACSQETDLYFYQNGSWKTELSFTYDPLLSDRAKRLIDLGLRIFIEKPKIQIREIEEKGLDVFMLVIRERNRVLGIKTNWGKKFSLRPPVTYQVGFSGADVSQFNALFPEGIAVVEPQSEGICSLRFDLSELNYVFEAVGIQTIRVHTSEVIKSNADFIEKNTAVWENPQLLEITYQPQATIRKYVPWILVGVGVITAVLVWGFLGQKKRTQDSWQDDLDQSNWET